MLINRIRIAKLIINNVSTRRVIIILLELLLLALLYTYINYILYYNKQCDIIYL